MRQPAAPRIAWAPAVPRVGEWAGAAVVLAIGVALDWLCDTHPGELPLWAPWSFSWPEYLVAACGLWWYLRGIRRMNAAARPAPWQVLLFLTGLGLLWAALQTHFDYFAQHMFFLNRVQHIVMHHLGPFLIALAAPGAALRYGMPVPARRLAAAVARFAPFRVLQQPVVASLIFVGLVFLWLLPAVHFRAMLDRHLYAVMNWSMVLDGLLFWCLVLDPRPCPPARVSLVARLAAAFLVMFPMILLGTAIADAGRDLYPSYALCGRIFPGIDALADQQIGGLIIWVPAGMMSAVAALLISRRLFDEDDREHEKRHPAQFS